MKHRVEKGPWNDMELRLLDSLTSPAAVQAFLDSIPYSADPIYRSPRSVMRDRKAHCFDGALFAAAALRHLGHPPFIVDLQAVRDDDHILAIFGVNGHLGAVGKSNFVGLRYRDPIFGNLRELVLSYFEFYYNLEKEKTLRGYTEILDLSSLDELAWMTNDDRLEEIADKLDQIPCVKLLSEEMIQGLVPVDDRSYEAGMLGVNEAGLYKPGH
jgi:hypothetical protein